MAQSVRTRREKLHAEAPATTAPSDGTHDLSPALSEKLDAVWRHDADNEDCEVDQACTSDFQRLLQDDIHHVQMLRDEIERLCRQGPHR